MRCADPNDATATSEIEDAALGYARAHIAHREAQEKYHVVVIDSLR